MRGKNQKSPERQVFGVTADAESLPTLVQARVAVLSWRVAAFSLLAAAISIAVAGGAAIWQLEESKKQAQEIEARAIYAQYLQLALDNPDLAYGPDANQTKSDISPAALATRYDWYASSAFNAFERIALTQKNDLGWGCVIAEQLYWHRERVQSQVSSGEFGWSYNDDLQRLARVMLAATESNPENSDANAICDAVRQAPR